MSNEEDVLQLIFTGEDEDDFDEEIAPEIEKQLLSDSNSIKDNDSDIYDDKNDDTGQNSTGANKDHQEKAKELKNDTKSSNPNKFNRFNNNNKRKNTTNTPNQKKFRPQRPFQPNRDIFPNFSQVFELFLN